MVIAIDPEEVFDYILKDDRGVPETEQTVWKLRCLSAREQAAVEDGAVSLDPDTQSMRVDSGSVTLRILRGGLAGVENFRDSAGNLIEFSDRVNGKAGSRREPRDEFLSRIHPKYRKELAEAITNKAILTEEDRENSSSPPA